MSDSEQSHFCVTTDDLRRYDWQMRLAQHAHKECHSFYGVLIGGAEECHAANDDLGHRVFSFLGAVASFYLVNDAKGTSYGSMWSGVDGKRSLNAEDLTDADLAALSGIVNEIEDPEFRSRVADVLWVTQKDFKAARTAVTAFLESAQRLKTDDLWPPYTERLERAARIAAYRGFEKEKMAVAVAVEAAIAEFATNSKGGLLCQHLMSILLAQDEGDIVRYAALAERLATDFATAGDWHCAESYWLLAGQWHNRAKNAAENQRCQLAAAECNVSRGEAGLPTQDAMYAAHWLGRGLEALRRSKASPARIKAVHLRFRELQQRSIAEFKPIEVSGDTIPGFREHEKLTQDAAAARMRGCDFQSAITRFANITRPTDFEQLKKQHIETSANYISARILGSSTADHSGKISDAIPPTGVGTPEQQAETLRKRLCHDARTFNWPVQVVWKIEPARIALLEEHAIRQNDLLFLVQNNPFIPQGHEGIYLRGLQAGFFGDWLVAMHLLIPQIEASIRYVLQQYGNVTSTCGF